MSDVANPTALTDAELRAHLQQALALLNRNEFVAAESTLESILAQRPEEADALQLMGLLRRLQNRPQEAEQFYRRSIAANASLPQVHHNLGNLLRAQARYAEAAECQRAAIRLRPNYVEAHMNLGLALQDMQDFAAAEQAFRDALRIQPNSLMLKQCLGAVLNDQKCAAESEALMRQALLQSTRDPRQTGALLHNLGVSLKIQGRYPEALEAIAKAQALVPDMPVAEYNRGNVLQHLGRLEEAVDAYRAAIARSPLNLNAHRDLNQLLYRLGRDEEFLRSYDDAALLYPEFGQLYLAKANFLFHIERYEEAQENYGRAMPTLPHHVMSHDGFGVTLARLGRFDEAITAHEAAVKLEPENAHAWVNFSETLIRAGDASASMDAAERAIAIEPSSQQALALWGVALRTLGDAREEWLNDYERFVQVFELDPPDGYADMESFNRDLNAYLNVLHRDHREFLDQTLRGGTQTLGDIFGAGHDLVERLRARVDEAVAAYIARMKEDAEHPFNCRRRAQFGYTGSWSSRLRDCGFHTNHVHPKGWISSAYYIAVPQAVDDSREKQGWLKFGEPAFEPAFNEPVRRAIKPAPGKLVLFPSYMWHGTVPFHSAEARTTIAFDAVPK
jgi:tetratricopeptide (TPR) repeat protein